MQLRLFFSPSRRLAGLLTLAHAAGAIVVFIVDWPLWLQASVTLALSASWVFCLCNDAMRRFPFSTVAALLKDDGSIEVTRRDGTVIIGRQISGSFVHPWFTTILWRGDAARFSHSIAVLSDSLPPEQFRELRVWLKWRRMEKAQEG